MPLDQLGVESQQLLKARQRMFSEVILDLSGESAEGDVVNYW